MKKKTGEWSLWLAVGGLFVLLLCAWAVMFTVAKKNPVQTVPLEHREQR